MDKENKNKQLWTKDFINITLVNLLLFCGFQMILTTLPLYVKSLGGTDSIIGWLSGVATISSLLVRPFSGIALDKFGRKVILLMGILIIALVTISYGWLPAIGIVLFVRFLHGFGWGIASTASNTIASDVIPKNRFGEGMGYFSLSSSLSMAIAPVIALTILGVIGFRKLSIISGVLALIAFILSFFIDYCKVTKTEGKNILVSPYEKASIMPSLVMFFITSSYGAIVGFISLYASTQGVKNVGLFFMVYAVSLLLIRPISGKIVDRMGFNAAVYPGLILLVISMIILSYASVLHVFLLSAVLYGIGFGAVQSSLQTMAITNAPKERSGAANATFFTGFDAGIGFGSVVGGMVASAIGYSRMYLCFSIFLVVAFVLYIILSIKKDSGIKRKLIR